MNNNKISIIVPVYNVEKYVRATLNSIKQQIVKPDEVIIINDGSTDNSSKIILEYKNLKNWKIINTKNNGLGLTRNYGKRIAKGNYIYFLDSDDLITKDLVSDFKKIVNKYKYPDIILFSGTVLNMNNKFTPKLNLKFSFTGLYKKNDKLITKLIKKKESFPQASRYITKKKIWSDNNLNYPKGIFEDEAIFFPLLALSKCTVILTKAYFKYRTGRKNSIMHSAFTSNHAKNYLDLIRYKIKFIKKNYDLIKPDLKAWHIRLLRNTLRYIDLCLKTDSKILWNDVFMILLITKKPSFLIKIIIRIFKKKSFFYLKEFFNLK
jgi:glycosyltransferase involved in cell wall biosynthesis